MGKVSRKLMSCYVLWGEKDQRFRAAFCKQLPKVKSLEAKKQLDSDLETEILKFLKQINQLEETDLSAFVEHAVTTTDGALLEQDFTLGQDALTLLGDQESKDLNLKDQALLACFAVSVGHGRQGVLTSDVSSALSERDHDTSQLSGTLNAMTDAKLASKWLSSSEGETSKKKTFSVTYNGECRAKYLLTIK